jgi:hypothetical protein
LNFSLLPNARPPLTMILAAVSSGRSFLAISRPRNSGQARVGNGRDAFNRGAAAGGRCGVEARGAHGQHLDGVGALHGGDGVAGVDRALEGVGADHLHRVADLRHVQQRGDTRCDVLAGGRGRKQHMAVGLGHGHDLRGQRLCQAVAQRCAVGVQHLGHTGDLRGGLGHAFRIGAGHQQVHVTTAGQRRGDGVEGRTLDVCVVVFGNDEACHLRSPWLRS